MGDGETLQLLQSANTVGDFRNSVHIFQVNRVDFGAGGAVDDGEYSRQLTVIHVVRVTDRHFAQIPVLAVLFQRPDHFAGCGIARKVPVYVSAR